MKGTPSITGLLLRSQRAATRGAISTVQRFSGITHQTNITTNSNINNSNTNTNINSLQNHSHKNFGININNNNNNSINTNTITTHMRKYTNTTNNSDIDTDTDTDTDTDKKCIVLNDKSAIKWQKLLESPSKNSQLIMANHFYDKSTADALYEELCNDPNLKFTYYTIDGKQVKSPRKMMWLSDDPECEYRFSLNHNPGYVHVHVCVIVCV